MNLSIRIIFLNKHFKSLAKKISASWKPWYTVIFVLQNLKIFSQVLQFDPSLTMKELRVLKNVDVNGCYNTFYLSYPQIILGTKIMNFASTDK
jgi:flagellar motor switch protein FliM